MMVSMVTPAQSQVDWSIKAGIGMANIIGDNMGSPKVMPFFTPAAVPGVFIQRNDNRRDRHRRQPAHLPMDS